jgi:hypothetical protein
MGSDNYFQQHCPIMTLAFVILDFRLTVPPFHRQGGYRSSDSIVQGSGDIAVVQDASTLQNYIFQLAIRQITVLITSRSLMGIDYADVMFTICGGIMKFGAGIACGDEGAFKAAKKASASLISQAVELKPYPAC